MTIVVTTIHGPQPLKIAYVQGTGDIVVGVGEVDGEKEVEQDSAGRRGFTCDMCVVSATGPCGPALAGWDRMASSSCDTL